MMQLGYSHFTALRIMVNDQLLSIGKSGAVTYIYAVDNGTGKLVRNRLYHVSDLQANSSAFTDDIDDQGSFTAPNQSSVSNVNYDYTEIGELAKDKAEHIDSIRWNVYGKVERVYYNDGTPSIQFLYDGNGNRIAKLLKNISVSSANDTTYASTYYWRDAQGNILATEGKKYFSIGNNISSVNHATEVEYNILGSSRIGIYQDTIPYDITTYTPYGKYKRYAGRRQYELTNHLGNVMATVSDVKTFNGTGYKSKVLSAQMYYPFGMVMPARNYTASNYSSLFKSRYGFNGKERIDEIKGVYDYGFRIYDDRIGRPYTPDPLSYSYPHLSPYQFFSNNPILNIDLDGLEGVDYTRNIVLSASGTSIFTKEDAGNISRKAIYISQNNGTIHITHDNKQISFNPSSAPSKIGLVFNPGFYFATNIKAFSKELLASKKDLKMKVSAATGYVDNDQSKPLENGFVNTFRHFAWQSTIAMALGEKIAKRVGDYHEADGILNDIQKGEFAKDNVIDLLNNSYARDYAKGFKFSDVTKNVEAYAGYLNGLAEHLTSTVDGYKDDKTFESIRNGETKLFNPKDKNFKKLYESAKNLDQVK